MQVARHLSVRTAKTAACVSKADSTPIGDGAHGLCKMEVLGQVVCTLDFKLGERERERKDAGVGFPPSKLAFT